MQETMAIASNDDDWRACGFVHEQPGGSGKLIRNSEDRRAQNFAMAIACSAKINQSGYAARAYGHIDEAQTPRAAKRVTNNDGDALPGLLPQGGGQTLSGTVGIFWQERDEIPSAHIRMIDASIRTNETVMRFDNEHAIGAHDTARFAQHDFDEPRITRKFFC